MPLGRVERVSVQVGVGGVEGAPERDILEHSCHSIRVRLEAAKADAARANGAKGGRPRKVTG